MVGYSLPTPWKRTLGISKSGCDWEKPEIQTDERCETVDCNTQQDNSNRVSAIFVKAKLLYIPKRSI